jgi:hypothetical protein
VGDKKWTIPETVSQESKDGAEKEGLQLIGVICKKGGTKEFQVVICSFCNCPRFADYKCDTCAKREMEHTYKKFEEKVSEFRVFLKQI